MKVKNISAQSFAINKSVQIDINTPDANDGLVLVGQVLDLSLSLSDTALMSSNQLQEGIYSGALVLVIDDEELSQQRSIEVYDSGSSEWAKTYKQDVSDSNLRAGIAGGFIYAKNCKIG